MCIFDSDSVKDHAGSVTILPSYEHMLLLLHPHFVHNIIIFGQVLSTVKQVHLSYTA